MKKYKSYSNAFFFILIPGLLLSLWMIFGTLSGIIREDKTDNLVVVIGILMTIGDLFLLSEVIRKVMYHHQRWWLDVNRSKRLSQVFFYSSGNKPRF